MNRKFNQIEVNIKNKLLTPNGRSSDFISPSFINGCSLGCKYCYVYRHNSNQIKIANNVDEILSAIESQVKCLPVKVPNQCGTKYTIDIGCNTDVSLYFKHLDWFKIFDKLIELDVMPTFATKWVNYNLLEYNSKKESIRIRYSILPQSISNILTPKGHTNLEKIKAMNYAYSKNWQVHLNLSPIVLYKNWLNDYKRLFEGLVKHLDKEVLEQLKTEIIFLTHNSKLHDLNVLEGFNKEDLLWQPTLQEVKTSLHTKDINLRYNRILKAQMISEFKKLYSEYFDLNTIRYIF